MQIKRKTGRKKPSRAQRSIRKLADLKSLTGYGIETYTGHEIAYFSLKPSNLSVLTPESVRARINALMNVLKGVAEITMMCLSSRENYAENKRYLRERIEEEANDILREQLRQDILLLDAEQTSMATAREFFLVLHLRGQNKLEIPPYLSHVEQIVREQGFTVRRAEPEDIMRVFAMYFEQYTYFKKIDRIGTLEGFARIYGIERTESAVIAFRFFLTIEDPPNTYKQGQIFCTEIMLILCRIRHPVHLF